MKDVLLNNGKQNLIDVKQSINQVVLNIPAVPNSDGPIIDGQPVSLNQTITDLCGHVFVVAQVQVVEEPVMVVQNTPPPSLQYGEPEHQTAPPTETLIPPETLHIYEPFVATALPLDFNAFNFGEVSLPPEGAISSALLSNPFLRLQIIETTSGPPTSSSPFSITADPVAFSFHNGQLSANFLNTLENVGAGNFGILQQTTDSVALNSSLLLQSVATASTADVTINSPVLTSSDVTVSDISQRTYDLSVEIAGVTPIDQIVTPSPPLIHSYVVDITNPFTSIVNPIYIGILADGAEQIVDPHNALQFMLTGQSIDLTLGFTALDPFGDTGSSTQTIQLFGETLPLSLSIDVTSQTVLTHQSTNTTVISQPIIIDVSSTQIISSATLNLTNEPTTLHDTLSLSTTPPPAGLTETLDSAHQSLSLSGNFSLASVPSYIQFLTTFLSADPASPFTGQGVLLNLDTVQTPGPDFGTQIGGEVAFNIQVTDANGNASLVVSTGPIDFEGIINIASAGGGILDGLPGQPDTYEFDFSTLFGNYTMDNFHTATDTLSFFDVPTGQTLDSEVKSLASDTHAGTLVTFNNGATIDFTNIAFTGQTTIEQLLNNHVTTSHGALPHP